MGYIKAYSGVEAGYITTHPLSRQWIEVNDQLHVPAALTRVPMSGRKLRGLQNRSGRFGEGQRPLTLPRKEPRFFGQSYRTLVTISTELSLFYCLIFPKYNYRMRQITSSDSSQALSMLLSCF